MGQLVRGFSVVALVCALAALAGVAVGQHRAIDRLEDGDASLGDEVVAMSDALDAGTTEIELLSSRVRSVREAVDRLDRQVKSGVGEFGRAQLDVAGIGASVDELASAIEVANRDTATVAACLAWVVSELDQEAPDSDAFRLPPNTCRVLGIR